MQVNKGSRNRERSREYIRRLWLALSGESLFEHDAKTFRFHGFSLKATCLPLFIRFHFVIDFSSSIRSAYNLLSYIDRDSVKFLAIIAKRAIWCHQIDPKDIKTPIS